MTSEYARAEGGNRAKMPKPGCHWDHFSIIGAISIFGIVALAYGRWATNALTFLSFIKDFLLKNLRKGHVIFMDNVQFHKHPEVRNLIESTGAKLVFLPPYSPDFSPIEKMWSKIKHYLKKLKSWSSAHFHTALSSALMELNDEDFEEWYDCCGYAME